MPIKAQLTSENIPPNTLVVCAGTKHLQNVSEMGSGFDVFKSLFKFTESPSWVNTVNTELAKGNGLPPYLTQTQLNATNAEKKLSGGIATVPQLPEGTTADKITPQQKAAYIQAVKEAIKDAQDQGKSLYLQPLGTGVYNWPIGVAAQLFDQAIKEQDPENKVNIIIPVFKGRAFIDALAKLRPELQISPEVNTQLPATTPGVLPKPVLPKKELLTVFTGTDSLGFVHATIPRKQLQQTSSPLKPKQTTINPTGGFSQQLAFADHQVYRANQVFHPGTDTDKRREAILVQDNTGKVEDHSKNLTQEEKRQTAVTMANMFLQNHDVTKPIIIDSSDQEMAGMVHAALLEKNPQLTIKNNALPEAELPKPTTKAAFIAKYFPTEADKKMLSTAVQDHTKQFNQFKESLPKPPTTGHPLPVKDPVSPQTSSIAEPK